MNQIRSSIVSTQEAEALKEMIFKRARERAEQMDKDLQEDYTTSVQNDVMDIARSSFVANKNPFSEIIKADTKSSVEIERSEYIGFPERKTEIKTQIINNNKVADSSISAVEIQGTMDDAFRNLSSKKTFIGALEFLNSQATIALVNKKAKKFEALA